MQQEQNRDTNILLKVTTVICCHSIDRLDDIRKCIESSLNQAYVNRETVIAVDHNQELFDRLTTEFSSSVTLVMNHGIRGLSDTRNAGINVATGEIIAFIDDDAEAKSNCLEKLAQHYRNPDVVGVGGRSIAKWAHGRPGWFPEELDWIVGSTYKGAPEKTTPTLRLIGCNMSFRREAFNRAGMFNTGLGRVENKGEGEDSEICMRVRQRFPDKVLIYEPSAIVYHKVPHQRATFNYLVSRSYSGGRAVASISRMHAHSSLSSQSKINERSYLNYLLSTAIPGKLIHIYKRNSIRQLFTIITSIIATGTGYAIGTLKNFRNKPV